MFQNIADMNHTDDMVLVFVAKRKTRMVVLADKIHCFVIAVIFINTLNVLPRNHNFMGAGFRKANGVLNNFAFGIINNAAFLRGVDNQFDFFFGMGVSVFVAGFDAHQLQNANGDMVKNPDKRRKNPVKGI